MALPGFFSRLFHVLALLPFVSLRLPLFLLSFTGRDEGDATFAYAVGGELFNNLVAQFVGIAGWLERGAAG